jgi:hypothetical protein
VPHLQFPGHARRYDPAVLGQGWQSQWERVQRRLDDVRVVYTGRPGGTDAAIDTVQSFFEAVHHLKDWLRNDPSSGITKADADSLINGSTTLQLCADLANGSKHLVLTSSRTGDRSTRITRNDVTVFPGTAGGSVAMSPKIPSAQAATGMSAHRFYVASAGHEYDVLQLAEDATAEWHRFLSSQGLIS